MIEYGRDSDMLLSDNTCETYMHFHKRELDSHANSHHLWSVQITGDFKIHFYLVSASLELFCSMIIFILRRATWSWNDVPGWFQTHKHATTDTTTDVQTYPPPCLLPIVEIFLDLIKRIACVGYRPACVWLWSTKTIFLYLFSLLVGQRIWFISISSFKNMMWHGASIQLNVI